MWRNLKYGETFESFNLSGKMPSLNELWKIINNG